MCKNCDFSRPNGENSCKDSKNEKCQCGHISIGNNTRGWPEDCEVTQECYVNQKSSCGDAKKNRIATGRLHVDLTQDLRKQYGDVMSSSDACKSIPNLGTYARLFF